MKNKVLSTRVPDGNERGNGIKKIGKNINLDDKGYITKK